MKTQRVRFSLRLLILLVTAVALFLGFSQYRRQSILKVSAELQKEGLEFVVPNDLRDHLWQRIPLIAFVNEDGTLAVSSKNWEQLWNDKPKKEQLVKLGFIRFANQQVRKEALGQ